jgi:hypothetical protein
VEKGKTYARSEGLAVASFHMFANKKVDLAKVTVDDVAREFQVGKDNPLVGLEGRTGLVRALGEAIAKRPDLFPGNRIGGVVDTLSGKVPAERVLSIVLEGLGPIWPGRVELEGVNLGDVWPHPQVGLVPFHKLSQWLTYSLLEPLQTAGLAVTEVEGLIPASLMFDLRPDPHDPRV